MPSFACTSMGLIHCASKPKPRLSNYPLRGGGTYLLFSIGERFGAHDRPYRERSAAGK